jgi:hypothetical protein
MKSRTTLWQRLGLQNWFLKNSAVAEKETPIPTPEKVYRYITDKFNESIEQLSFANRIVFYHEYIICLNPDDYQAFMANKQGLFGLITQECVKSFYALLASYRDAGKTVEPSATKWVFRFVSHPEYARGDIGFIGKLLPDSDQRDENVRVTFIPRQTGIAETFDVSQDVLKGFTFYSEGYYEIPFIDALQDDEKSQNSASRPSLGRLETILPDKAFAGRKVEYVISDDEVIITGTGDAGEAPATFRVPSDWVDTPHLRIRYNRETSQFYLASFGEKTLLNEKEVVRSNNNTTSWVELPFNSKMLLNGIVGINLFKP